MTIFWILFWWIALSFPTAVLAGKMLRRAAEQQTREL